MANTFNISVKPEIAAVQTVVNANSTAIGLIRSADVVNIQTNINTNKTKIDVLIDRAKPVSIMEFWSTPDGNTLTLTDTPADKNLPNIIVSNLPSDITILWAELMFTYTNMYNYYAGNNKMNTNQKMRIKKSTGTWDTDDIDGISFEQYDFSIFTSNGFCAGALVHGDADIKTVVDGNATYNIQLEDGAAEQVDLRLLTPQVGIKIWFQPT